LLDISFAFLLCVIAHSKNTDCPCVLSSPLHLQLETGCYEWGQSRPASVTANQNVRELLCHFVLSCFSLCQWLLPWPQKTSFIRTAALTLCQMSVPVMKAQSKGRCIKETSLALIIVHGCAVVFYISVPRS